MHSQLIVPTWRLRGRIGLQVLNTESLTRPNSMSSSPLEIWLRGSPFSSLIDGMAFAAGCLFRDPSSPKNFVTLLSAGESVHCGVRMESLRRRIVATDVDERSRNGVFMSVRVSVGEALAVRKREKVEGGLGEEEKEKGKVAVGRGTGALNTTKHLWAGAVATMVSRTLVAPLERLKLEYMVRGEQRNLFEVVQSIATSQGLKGFWKGNFVNILRTAPFKAINFYAYDTYMKHFLRISGNKETTNFERFIAGAAAGITATIIGIPMDTIRTKLIAPGGEALGGVTGVFCHLVQTEGFFSLYKGLLPSIISMVPAGAIFYGVYDILKSTYMHSHEGMRRKLKSKQHKGRESNALDQLELSPLRTLLYGAIAGSCAEVATYPFEMVRRHLQMQVRANNLSAFATFVKIIEEGGVTGLYAGLLPSLLQVLPSASITYFVYELMKIVLKVE